MFWSVQVNDFYGFFKSFLSCLGWRTENAQRALQPLAELLGRGRAQRCPRIRPPTKAALGQALGHQPKSGAVIGQDAYHGLVAIGKDKAGAAARILSQC